MNATPKTIQTFKDLHTWQEAHQLVINIYKITEQFPQKERYILCSQLQRAGISITSNIAEGFSRNTSKDRINFYHTALGSLTEVENQLLLAKDLNYTNSEEFKQIDIQIQTVSRMLIGLIKATQHMPKTPHNKPLI